MTTRLVMLYSTTLLLALLFKGGAYARNAESTSKRKIPRDIGAVARMQYLNSRQINAFTPELLDIDRGNENYLDRLWTSWSDWSDCSRTCGGGVTSRSRKCTSRITENVVDVGCEGSAFEYKLCNSQVCTDGLQDYREQQCAQHNDDEYLSRRFEWISFAGKDGNTCELSCVAKNYHFYNTFGPVEDGTRCGQGSKGICIKSKCMKIGCDGEIGSDVTKDMCGICGGRNESCIHTSDVVDHLPDLNSGYNKIAEIPIGATNIKVKDHNGNYLALMELEGDTETYAFNGNWIISYSGDYKVAGTTVTYERDSKKESFEIEGPTQKELTVLVLSLGEQPLVEYEYWMPLSQHSNSEFQLESHGRRIEVPDEDDYRNQILAAGLDFDSLPLPTLEPTTTVPEMSTTPVTTEATTETEAPARRTTSRPQHCTPCKKTINKKKHFCDSDFVIHVRILPRRRLQRGRFVRYAVEILDSYKSKVRLMRREYVWISNTCCPRLRPYRHYLLMGRIIKADVTEESRAEALDLTAAKSHQFETRLLADHVEFWYTWRKYQIRMSRAARRINCKRYRYLAAKFYRRKHSEG